MAVNDCAYPVLGRFKALAIVLADDCGTPKTGVDQGWVDQCPGAFAYTEDVEEGEDFRRACADGTTMVSAPGRVSLNGYDLQLDLHTVEPQLWGDVAGATPVSQDGTVVGWDQCRDSRGSAALYLWREVVQAGGAACGQSGSQQYLLTIFPWVDQIRIVEQGTFGGADGFLRLTGTARTGHSFGVGALPVFPDLNDPVANPPVCMEQPIDPSCAVRHVLTEQPWPDACGFVEVTPCA